MLVEKIPSARNALAGKTAIVTGAGGGIGLEAAKALRYMGARVAIIEIDREKGKRAEAEMLGLFGPEAASFHYFDLGDEEALLSFVRLYRDRCGCPDILINNAAVVIVGAVDRLASADWDRGYRVNLKAPILLTREFLPGMKERRSGTICFVPSSGAAPYMGAYEVYKTAQAEFCSTLCGEIENTGVHAYSIAPGLVRTETADAAIAKVAAMMGIAKEGIYESNAKNMLTSEEAGTAFALSVLSAENYNGLEIGSIQVLNDLKLLEPGASVPATTAIGMDAMETMERILGTFRQQHKGWKERNLFEREWLMRDFRKKTGYSTGQMEASLVAMCDSARDCGSLDGGEARDLFERLEAYYENQYRLLQGWEKDPAKLRESSNAIRGWIGDIDCILVAMRPTGSI